ncbi:MAG: hypothetical protein ACTSSG_08690 [Candidatus Heimdallarchaeaceae archaeon]
MKRGISYFICANIVIAMFLGGLLNLNSVSAYQQLNVDDQILYKILNQETNTYEYQLWLENKPVAPYEYEESRWDLNTYEGQRLTMKSYRITYAAPDYSTVNQTTSSYEIGYHNWGEHYSFNYDASVYDWVLDYTYDDDTPGNYNSSYASYDEYKQTYPNITCLDPLDTFSSAIFNYSTTISLEINGGLKSLDVDVYIYEDVNIYTGTNFFYNLSYTMNYKDYTQYIYYVDPSTSLIVQIEDYYYYEGNGTFSDYSTDLQTNVNGIDFYSYQSSNTWLLYETTVAYGGTVDADLPALWLLDSIDKITNSTVNVLIPTYVSDYYSTVTVDIFIDNMYYSTLNNIATGNIIFSIPANDIKYMGLFCGHEIRFNVYDDSNFNHNSTWEFWIQDSRTREPTWGPSYLSGPTDVTIFEGDYSEEFYVYSDTNWTVEFYKYDGGSYNFLSSWYGYLNESVWLWDYGLSAGTYEYWIHLYDSAGETDDIYLTVSVIAGGIPQINGPSGDYYYTVGDDITLWWQLYDDNPHIYEIRLDSKLIAGAGYYDGQAVSFELKNNIFSAGDYTLSIFANDTTGLSTILELYIHASGETVDTIPPSITGPTETIYMKQGEAKSIEWNLFDDNPASYSVYQNGTMIKHVEPWTNQNENVVIDLSVIEVGTWYFEIEAYDGPGNYNSAGVLVVIELGTDDNNNTETTTNGGSNTVNLDAPSVFFYSLAFFSIAALTVILRKRR